MKQTMPLCLDCRKDLQAAGYQVKQVSEIINRITCGVCGRNTYGSAFTITKGEKNKNGEEE